MTRPSFSPSAIANALNGRFTIENPLGDGAQGIVFRALRVKAEDGTPADDLIALKLYFSDDQDERVEREITAMQRIRHHTLAALVEHGSITLDGEDIRFCAWEFVPGMPLDKRLIRGPLGSRAVAAVGRDVAAAISEIWKHTIVHRDISPKNVMLKTGERDAVLIDLGVARHLSEPSLTAYGFSWGTPGYLSPEQCRTERDLTCKSDVFALGIVLLECLTGKHPTRGNQQQLLQRQLKAAEIAPEAPAAFVKVLDAMVHPRAVNRPHPDQISTFFDNFLSGPANVLP